MPSPSAILALPDAQVAALRVAYDGVTNRRRRRMLAALAVLLLAVALATWIAEIDPVTVWRKIGGLTSYLDRITTLDSGARVWTDPLDWFWGWKRWLRLLGETLLMSYVGTLIGVGFAFFACFVASANVCRLAWLRFTARRVLEFCRTVPVIVFALLFVVAFGIGALPGVLALAVHTAGTLGKQFTEAVENADTKPCEGIRAGGGGLVSEIRFGILPQVLSTFISFALLRFEINVRDATVMGFVGAGGIGLELMVAIQRFYYPDISAILVLIIVTVSLLDVLSERMRHRMLGAGSRH